MLPPKLISLTPVSSYFRGLKGVWRPDRSYTYVENRNANENQIIDGKPDLKADGEMDGVTMFNWENPFFAYCDEAGAKNWRWTNQITKYAANGEEVENRDVLGIYSSALYGCLLYTPPSPRDATLSRMPSSA